MTDPKTTAEEASVEPHVQARELVDAIYDRLQDLPAPACGHPVHSGVTSATRTTSTPFCSRSPTSSMAAGEAETPARASRQD
jgi:hypothetical protein